MSVLFLIAASFVFAFWSMGKPWFWALQISRYEREDRVQPPKPGGIVFTGSSSIRFWATLSADMRPLEAINRGFGGAHLAHVNYYASRIVIPYRPRAIVLYAGENDMSWPTLKSGETVLRDLQQFVKMIHVSLPETWIYYVSMKPDPRRWRGWPRLRAANGKIEEYCRTQERVQYIDVSAAMLDAQGQPRRELFRRDGLHMNERGYAIWTSIIKPILLSRFGPGLN